MSPRHWWVHITTVYLHVTLLQISEIKPSCVLSLGDVVPLCKLSILKVVRCPNYILCRKQTGLFRALGPSNNYTIQLAGTIPGLVCSEKWIALLCHAKLSPHQHDMVQVPSDFVISPISPPESSTPQSFPPPTPPVPNPNIEARTGMGSYTLHMDVDFSPYSP